MESYTRDARSNMVQCNTSCMTASRKESMSALYHRIVTTSIRSQITELSEPSVLATVGVAIEEGLRHAAKVLGT